ncbi:uncharacterized protein LOC107362826 isoform X2 [Tetranychus urticae]|nr:uncharacterized protein LOC107362826 isoform X2 [Tetranychus urticae]
MISRKKILSKSCDKIIDDCKHYNDQEIWFNKDKLFKDHIREILDKWDQIDDDIWAKVIFMERNRRVAKAYVRAQVITFNGSERGFDGHLVGLKGFANSKRDERTAKVLEDLGEGIKMKIDESGDILIKRLTRSNVKVSGSTPDYNCLGSELIESNGRLEMDRAMTLFQMKKLISTIGSEIRSTYPNQRRLENQCITCISVDIESDNLLETPCWMMVINIVAMEVIKYKLPCIMMKYQKIPDFVAIFDNQQKQIQQQKSVNNNKTSSNDKSNQHLRNSVSSNSSTNSSTNNSSCSSFNPVNGNNNISITTNNNVNNNNNAICSSKVDVKAASLSVPITSGSNGENTNGSGVVKRKSESKRTSEEMSPSPPYKENKECLHHHHHHHHSNNNQPQVKAVKQLSQLGRSKDQRVEMKEISNNSDKIAHSNIDSVPVVIKSITVKEEESVTKDGQHDKARIEIPMPDYDKCESDGSKMKRREEDFIRTSDDKISDQLLLGSLPKIEETCLYQLNACLNGHPKSVGYLNSAMRKLPVNSRLSSCSSSSDSSQSSGSEPSYYHIYSSIGEGIKITNCLPTNHLVACDKIIRYYVGNWE